MRTIFLIFITVLFIDSCKTNKPIDPPVAQEIADPIEIQDDYKPLGNDIVSGKVIHNDSSAVDLVAIKLTVNDSVCVNAYGNFDGVFSINYKDSMMNENSYFEFVFRDYTMKKISFFDFPKNGNVLLDKNGELVNYDQYRDFYESIRACTR
ncbi:hypothetical protein [uncultured Aquimarina sp.]|uniref:hypothetical protein n=1 Tax=uncultured Aquimarina sp. TaxID=575652 RepID=UPI002613A709|nr:hypothetical protein [uncultured Aquimarina sp.]